MITSGITITSTAEEKCSTLPVYNILIYPRSADIETCPNELYTLIIFLIQNRSSKKKYNCIFDQNPIHWAELTGPNSVSVPFANNRKGWYKSIVGRWPKMMISVARFSQDNLGARWSILRDTDKANNVRPIPQFLVTFWQWIYIIPFCCWQREHWLPDWSQSTPPNELGFGKKYSYTFFELLFCIRKMPIVYNSFENVSISALRG